MPTREQLVPAVMNLVSQGSSQTVSYPRMLGRKQSISALNNVGKWVPGQYRANPVVLEKWTGLSSPSTSTGVDRYQSYYGEIEGDLAAVISKVIGFDPTNANVTGQCPWDSIAAGHSLQKAYASMNEAELDVGVMLGELHETFVGLLNPVKALREYLSLANKLLRKGKVPKASDALNMLSGSWLEWRYGIMPLIYTIQDIIEQVQNQSRFLQNQLLRKKGKVAFETNQALPGLASGTYWLYGTARVNVKTKYVSSVFYNYVKPLSWNSRYGLDLSSIPGIAWEVAKLSFVWDWFFSVGDWLQSLRMSDARIVQGSTTSQKSTVTVDASVDKVLFYNQVVSKTRGGSYQLVYERLDRRVNQALPVSPVVNREALSLKRQIDAIALMWQQLPKIRR